MYALDGLIFVIRYLVTASLFGFYLLVFWELGNVISKPRLNLVSIVSLSSSGLAGGFLAVAVSALINFQFFVSGLGELCVRLIAPVGEEVVKALVILAFLSWSKLRRITRVNRDWMILFGLIVGLSFAAIENVFYIFELDISLDVVVERGFLIWGMHMVNALLFSCGLKTVEGKQRLWILPYLAAAILIHLIVNNRDIILQFVFACMY